MEHTVSYCLSQGLAKVRNEDLIGFFDNIFWLLDGASIPSDISVHPKFDTLWYVKHLSLALTEIVCADSSRPLSDLLSDAIASLVERYFTGDGAAELRGYYPPSSTVVLTRITAQKFDYLVLGDSYLLTDANGSVESISDLRLRHVATDLREQCARLLRARELESLAEVERRLARRELAARNSPEGYWIAGLESAAAEHAITGTCMLSQDRSRLLALSDGLAAAYEHLSLYSSWKELLDAVETEGFQALINRIRHEEAADSFGKTHSRPRISDDASGLLIQIAP